MSRNPHEAAAPPAATPVPLQPPQSSYLSRRDVLHIAGGTVSIVAMTHGGAPAISAERAEVRMPPGTVRFTVNQRPVEVRLDSRQSLLDVLRETLNLTGTKKGCNQGACGACTILLNGRRVVSCLTLAAMQEGAEIETIEGLAEGERLHPLQAAFIKHDGLQCGFCTPGQIMSGLSCIAEGHAGSREEIKFWMSGNICRCGAYPGIVEAVAEAAGEA